MARKSKFGNGFESRFANALMAAAKGKTEMRTQAYDVIGRPDFVFDTARVAVFCDGCWFHGCPIHLRLPVKNRNFWRRKKLKSRKRDNSVKSALESRGWKVFRVWECATYLTHAKRIMFTVNRLLLDMS